MKLKSVSIIVAITLLILSGCDPKGDSPLQPGQITFSFAKKDADGSTGGRAKDQNSTPRFASYSIRNSDNSLISDKIELFEFNGDFVSIPQQLPLGHYALEMFLILNEANQILYASPAASSPLAYLVEHPLPLEFDIAANAVTNLVPEVLGLADHTPEEFGYAKFGFEVVEKLDFDVTATIADNDPHPTIDYILEIIAKDAPLGNVLWTTAIDMNAIDEIHVPSRYNHYTFKATKQGYIDHVQHFLKSELSQLDHLYFEFLPEGLDDFHINEKDLVKVYTSKDRCKDYARVDMPEGYRLSYIMVTRTASAPSGIFLDGGARWRVCGDPNPDDDEVLPCRNNINLFDNVPFGMANDHCALVDLDLSTTIDSMDEVIFQSDVDVSWEVIGVDFTFSKVFYTNWNQGDSHTF
jgi:hypothetical protein